MELLSVLSIEACWPLCVNFSLPLLFSSLLSFLFLFLMLLFTDTVDTTPEHSKFLSFPSFLQPLNKSS